ncbi:MAG: DUF6044 family protein [Lachnospiraceae bacterium]|nr:DUF6044 family protein [Lachnospiraceae bacterium]
MTDISAKKQNIDLRKFILPLCGCVLSVLSMLPFFILGEKSIITYNDQLDGELITYILNAKHLFEGAEVYPELMNGIPVAGMVSPAPLFVLLFKFFKPFTAFMIMTALTRISGFLSTYLLCEKITKKSLISFAAGLAFMMLPFYPVYGLCIPGLAFVVLACIYMTEEKPSGVKIAISIFLSILYALTSSLALVGFAVVSALAVYMVIVLIAKSRIGALRLLISEACITVTYALCNMPLIKQILGIGKSFVSHKSEILIADREISDIYSSYLFGDYPYTFCAQKVILVFLTISLLAAGIVLIVKKPSASLKRFFAGHYSVIASLVFINVVIALILIYNHPGVIAFRNSASGVLHDFNFERISWLLPVAWMVLLADSASLLEDCIRLLFEKKKTGDYGTKQAGTGPVVKVLAVIPGLAACAVIFAIAGFKSDVKTSLMRIIKGTDYKQISFGQFYSEDLFDEVDKIIGRDKSEYRVISLGLLPASAAYNGFYCLDAYSNNYDVEYKHEFRKIMENELAKSDYYTSYFDEWGNRCYIYLSAYKTGINANFYNITFYDTDIDFAKAKEMGADYVISASPVDGYDDRGLELMNGAPVTSDDGWYDLYVYKIK